MPLMVYLLTTKIAHMDSNGYGTGVCPIRGPKWPFLFLKSDRAILKFALALQEKE